MSEPRRYVHFLMQDADDIDQAIRLLFVKQDMGTDSKLAITRTDVVGRAALPDPAVQGLASGVDIADVALRLINAPVLLGIIPDRSEIIPCAR